MEILKPTYGLADSGDEQHRILDDHIKIDLKMTPTIIDLSLHCQFEDDQLVGNNGSYDDDILRAGTDNWKILSSAALERFETTISQHAPFIFTGMHVTDFENMYHIDQDFYLSKIE